MNLELTAPAGSYRCAIDVDSKQSATGVEWRVLKLPQESLGAVAALPPGYRDLAMSPESGAVDYVRHPALRPRPGCLPGPAAELSAAARAWRAGSQVEAAEALEEILVVGAQMLIFGEPFRTGLGMHNIHQNQGDPAGSQWWDENGIWQDGATIVRSSGDSCDVFLSKFSTQSYRTDEQGHPR